MNMTHTIKYLSPGHSGPVRLKILFEPFMQPHDYRGNEVVDRQIPGLYFCCTILATGDVPRTSPYGSHRFLVPVRDSGITTTTALFFYNFYCSPGFGYTILAAVNDPELQKKCSEDLGLKKLDPEHNAFLRFVGRDKEVIALNVTSVGYVELYLTWGLVVKPSWKYDPDVTSSGRNRPSPWSY
ncbi:hypothetical protein BC832DRAFT_249901 [Gaertneriomyces semiglobifer]|nr:hypothetical protein BC832DRAFT_249901 [Gaertneriomyces semiglobifer]